MLGVIICRMLVFITVDANVVIAIAAVIVVVIGVIVIVAVLNTRVNVTLISLHQMTLNASLGDLGDLRKVVLAPHATLHTVCERSHVS